MEQIFNFISSIDWKSLIVAILAILGGASVIAKITPWDWDDKAVGVVTRIIRALGLTKYE